MARIFDSNAANYMSRASVNFGLNGATAFSIAAWVKLTAVNPSVGQVLASKNSASGVTWYFVIKPASSTITVGMQSVALGQIPEWTTTSGIGTGVWTRALFAFQRSAGTSADAVLYLNGVAASTSFAAGGYTSAFTIEENSNTLMYGQDLGGGGLLDAALAWMTIWSRQLTAADALKDYANPGAVRSGLVHSVMIGAGNDNDLSGNALDMSVTGTLATVTDPAAGKVRPLYSNFPKRPLRDAYLRGL